MTIEDEKFEKIVSILKRHGAEKIAVFGSYARGEEKPDSDIDILVKFSKSISLLNIVKIEREISEALDKKIDLLTEKSISPYLRERINKEAKVVYE